MRDYLENGLRYRKLIADKLSREKSASGTIDTGFSSKIEKAYKELLDACNIKNNSDVITLKNTLAHTVIEYLSLKKISKIDDMSEDGINAALTAASQNSIISGLESGSTDAQTDILNLAGLSYQTKTTGAGTLASKRAISKSVNELDGPILINVSHWIENIINILRLLERNETYLFDFLIEQRPKELIKQNWKQIENFTNRDVVSWLSEKIMTAQMMRDSQPNATTESNIQQKSHQSNITGGNYGDRNENSGNIRPQTAGDDGSDYGSGILGDYFEQVSIIIHESEWNGYDFVHASIDDISNMLQGNDNPMKYINREKTGGGDRQSRVEYHLQSMSKQLSDAIARQLFSIIHGFNRIETPTFDLMMKRRQEIKESMGIFITNSKNDDARESFWDDDEVSDTLKEETMFGQDKIEYQKLRDNDSSNDDSVGAVGKEVFELKKRISEEFDEKFVNPPWFQYSDEFEKLFVQKWLSFHGFDEETCVKFQSMTGVTHYKNWEMKKFDMPAKFRKKIMREANKWSEIQNVIKYGPKPYYLSDGTRKSIPSIRQAYGEIPYIINHDPTKYNNIPNMFFVPFIKYDELRNFYKRGFNPKEYEKQFIEKEKSSKEDA